MILRSLRVEGWRCFAVPVEVGPFTDGLNIIHGPNGIGKSTLMTALARGLFDNHGVGGADIAGLRPWGRALNPKVAIEFEHDGERYQLQKQFLNAATSQLNRLESDRYVPLAESRDADERARKLLAGEAPGRGASDHRHWGLAQILWATQGSLHIEQLAGSTRATIEDALGAQIAAPGSDALEQQIADAYARFFTATGRLRSGATAPAIVGLQARLEAATSERVELQHRLNEFDDASRRIEDLQRQAQSAQRDEQELTEQLKELRSQAQAYRDLVGQQKLHQQAVAAAEDNYRSQNERIESIRSADQELQSTTRELQQRRDDMPAQAKLLQQVEGEAVSAERKVAEVRGRRAEVSEARQLAKLAERYAHTRERLGDLEERLGKIESTQQAIQRLRKLREEIVAPDKESLAEITRVARARDDARLRLNAALITVSITPASKIKLEVTQGEQLGTDELAPGTTKQLKGSPEVAFELAGIGEIRATGPTGDCEQLRQSWQAAVERFQELTAGLGTEEISVLETRRAEADELDRQLNEAEVKVDTWLGGQTLDALRDERSRAANLLQEILAEHPEWQDSPPEPTDASRRAEELDQAFTRDVEHAEADQGRAQRALQSAQQQQSAHEKQIARLEADAAALERRLQLLRQDGLDDQARREKLTQVAMQRDTALAKLDQVNQQIAALGDDPSKTLQVLEGQLDGLRTRANEAAQKLSSETGRLQQITSEAPYSALAAVDEEINVLQEEIARQQVEIDAVGLLHATLNDQRRDVMQSVLHPIRTRANHILQRIAGSRFEDVHFNDSLLPSGVAPKLAEDAVSLTQISGGEQEQVHFAVRMALADAAFQTDRQLVVLDDVFTYTDTTRLARIATILDEVADRFQIVLLTCHPERYRGLPNATFFDLESITGAE